MRLNNIQWMNEWLLTIAEDNWTMNWHWKWRNNATTAENGEEQKFNSSQVVALLQFSSLPWWTFRSRMFPQSFDVSAKWTRLETNQFVALLFLWLSSLRSTAASNFKSTSMRLQSNQFMFNYSFKSTKNPPKIHQKSTKNPPKVHPISPFSSPISIKLNQNSYLI